MERKHQRSAADLIKEFWGPIAGFLAVVAMMASLHGTVTTVAATQATQTMTLRELETRVSAHERLPWHDGADRRFADSERRLSNVEDEQRQGAREVRAALDRIEKNLTAVCIATPRASCK
jgi:hypothetical protein